MNTTEDPAYIPPIRARAAARQAIREHLEKEAHKRGYASYAKLEEAEYRDWLNITRIEDEPTE